MRSKKQFCFKGLLFLVLEELNFLSWIETYRLSKHSRPLSAMFLGTIWGSPIGVMIFERAGSTRTLKNHYFLPPSS